MDLQPGKVGTTNPTKPMLQSLPQQSMKQSMKPRMSTVTLSNQKPTKLFPNSNLIPQQQIPSDSNGLFINALGVKKLETQNTVTNYPSSVHRKNPASAQSNKRASRYSGFKKMGPNGTKSPFDNDTNMSTSDFISNQIFGTSALRPHSAPNAASLLAPEEASMEIRRMIPQPTPPPGESSVYSTLQKGGSYKDLPPMNKNDTENQTQNYEDEKQMSKPTPQQEQPLKPKIDDVVIHVFDEPNKISKDFVCNRDVLLKEMKYFQNYLTDSQTSLEDIDISVHCDVNIFQWLIDYITDTTPKPQLDSSWAVSILISSDFLQMEELVTSTLEFVKDHLQEIIDLPIELDCINKKLLNRLVALFESDSGELEKIKDPQNKIIGRIYMRKLEYLMSPAKNGKPSDNTTILQCKLCKLKYTVAQAELMYCDKADKYISFRGHVIARHKPDPNFNVNQFIFSLRTTHDYSWKKIYWTIWGLINFLHCTECKTYFPVAEVGNCRYHPEAPVFKSTTSSVNVGHYPCCNAVACRFDSSKASKANTGCKSKDHIVSPIDDNAKYMVSVFNKFKKYIRMPPNSLPANITDAVKEESIENLVQFSNTNNAESDAAVSSEDESDSSSSDEFSEADELRSNSFYQASKKFEVFNRFCGDVAPKKFQFSKEDKKKKIEINFNSPSSGRTSRSFKRTIFLDDQRDVDHKNLNQMANLLVSKCRFDSTNDDKKKMKEKIHKKLKKIFTGI